MDRQTAKRSFNRAEITFMMVVLFSIQLATVQCISDLRAEAGDGKKIIEKVRAEQPDLALKLDQIFEATSKYRDVRVALNEGYIRDPMNICEEAPMMGFPAFVGNMGIHYFHPELLKITGDNPRVNGDGTHTDFLRPGILIYEPQEDGSMELVAIENLVFKDAWHNVGHDSRPNFMGYEYFYMIDNLLTETDEAHMFEPHYDLHMWLYRENPNGLFSPFNPNVTCEYHKHSM